MSEALDETGLAFWPQLSPEGVKYIRAKDIPFLREQMKKAREKNRKGKKKLVW